MPTLTYDLQFIAPAAEWKYARAWIECSVESFKDAAGELTMGGAEAPLNAAGAGSVDLVATVTGVKYQLVAEYTVPGRTSGPSGKGRYESGWFSFTAAAALKDLATVDTPGPTSTPLLDHIAATSGAHVASAITYGGGPILPADTVEGALDKLDQRHITGALAAGTDLNTILTPGVYLADNATPNAPVTTAGTVVVHSTGGVANYQVQVWYSIAGNAMFQRRRSNPGAVWTPWATVVAGDTGWRNVSTLLDPAEWVLDTSAPTCRIRRVGDQCRFEARIKRAPGSPAVARASALKIMSVITGFNVGVYTPLGQGAGGASGSASLTIPYTMGIASSTANQLEVMSPGVAGNWAPGDTLSFAAQWITSAAFPAPGSYPGTPG